MTITLHDWDQWIEAIYSLVKKGLRFEATIDGKGAYLIELTGGY